VGDEVGEEDEGCLSIFALHFLVALAAFVSLLLIGFVINLLVHFEENQIKVIWIGVALLLATGLSGFIAKLRNKKGAGKKDQK
jgi:energy-coupling factor transporter transmembrane protein EcfT